MTFPETVRFSFVSHELKAVKWDLDRIRALLRELGDPQDRCRYVHVAGTNGKGSTCAMIASASAREGGFSHWALYFASPGEFASGLKSMASGSVKMSGSRRLRKPHAAAERLLAREGIDAHPSFFETVTAMAFLALARARVEMVVHETGLVGRLDATNVVIPEVAVITPDRFRS